MCCFDGLPLLSETQAEVPGRRAQEPLKKVAKCSQRSHAVADDFSNRQHGHGEDHAWHTPHPEPKDERDDDEDRIEGEPSGQKHRRRLERLRRGDQRDRHRIVGLVGPVAGISGRITPHCQRPANSRNLPADGPLGHRRVRRYDASGCKQSVSSLDQRGIIKLRDRGT